MAILKTVYDWLHPKPSEPPTTTAETQTLAEKAVLSAITDLRSAQDNRPKVENLVSESQNQLDRNHFAELVEASMRGRG